MEEFRRRLDATERNVTDQAKTLTALIEQLKALQGPLGQLRIDREVRKERDRNVYERFDRIEHSMQEGFERMEADIKSRFARLDKPVWAAAVAFIGAIVAAVTTWITKGGLSE